MRRAVGISIFVWGALLSSVSAQASGKTSFTTAIAGSTTAGVLAGSTVMVTLCSINTSVVTPCTLSSPLAFTCPVITLHKNGPQSIKASCTIGLKPTAFYSAIVVNDTACPASSGLIGGTASCNGVTVKIGK